MIKICVSYQNFLYFFIITIHYSLNFLLIFIHWFLCSFNSVWFVSFSVWVVWGVRGVKKTMAMSRRPINPSRRVADLGASSSSVSIYSKSRPSSYLSIVLIVLVLNWSWSISFSGICSNWWCCNFFFFFLFEVLFLYGSFSGGHGGGLGLLLSG